MYSFPKEKLNDFKTRIEEALKDKSATKIAAFDADGTLWATDVGKNFFNYQFRNRLVSNLPEDPWAHYQELYKTDRNKCYLWLAQINSGIALDTVKGWAKESVKVHFEEMGLFAGQKELISFLKDKGVEVYIVTASVKWAVEPAAQLLGVKAENVIGVETKVINGMVTDQQNGPITHSEGKVDGLLLKTKGRHPFFAAGNTKSDQALIESATHLNLVIGSAPQGHELYETERYMLSLARERAWLWHQFQ